MAGIENASIGYDAVMSSKVFYAWQSDRHAKCNRWLIRDALRLSIVGLNFDAKVTSAPAIELDHDTKGETGTPHIADTIERKIRQCAVFVADVTPVANYGAVAVRSGKRRKKQTPNPNVLIELGMAIKRPKWEFIILVMNSAHGDAEALPFDIQRSRPIQYNLPDTDDKAAIGAAMKLLATSLKPHLKAALERSEKLKKGTASNRLASRLAELDTKRARFENDVISGQFRGLEVMPGMLALSIQPIEPHEGLELHEVRNTPDLKPFGADTWGEREPFSESVIAHQTFTRMYGNRSSRVSVTEITTAGEVFAADNWMKLSQRRDPHGLLVRSIEDGPIQFLPVKTEPKAIEDIVCFVRGLRAMGVKGPLRISLSLLQVTNFQFRPSDGGMYERARVITDDEIKPKAVTIEESQDVSSRNPLAQLLRPILDHFWREFGYEAAYYFPNGEYAPGAYG